MLFNTGKVFLYIFCEKHSKKRMNMNIMLTIAALRNKINWCFNIIFLKMRCSKDDENEQEENDKECSLKWTLSS